MSNRTKDVLPLSDAHSQLTELVEDAASGADKIPTRNGLAYVAIIDARKLNHYQELEAEFGRLVMTDDAAKGLQDLLAGRVQTEQQFRKSLRRTGDR